MNNKNKILSLIIFLILALSIVAGVYLVKENQNLSEKAAAASSLSFSPSTSNILKGQQFTTSVRLSTSTNIVTGLDISLTFNPQIIQISQITPTSAISSMTSQTTGQIIKNEIDNVNGTARFVAYTTNKNLGITGQANILNVVGSVLNNVSPASYQINYSALTSIAALNEAQNSLISKSAYILTVLAPTPTASSSPTASPSPTPSPIPSPSPSPTPIAYVDWDVNSDGLINLVDIGLIVDDYGNSNPKNPRADIDRNGIINIIDIGIVIDHYLI